MNFRGGKDVAIDQSNAGRIEIVPMGKSPCLDEQIGFINLREVLPMTQDYFLLALIPDPLQQFTKYRTQGNDLSVVYKSGE